MYDAVIWISAFVILATVVGTIVLKMGLNGLADEEEDRHAGLKTNSMEVARGFEPVMKERENDHG